MGLSMLQYSVYISLISEIEHKEAAGPPTLLNHSTVVRHSMPVTGTVGTHDSTWRITSLCIVCGQHASGSRNTVLEASTAVLRHVPHVL